MIKRVVVNRSPVAAGRHAKSAAVKQSRPVNRSKYTAVICLVLTAVLLCMAFLVSTDTSLNGILEWVVHENDGEISEPNLYKAVHDFDTNNDIAQIRYFKPSNLKKKNKQLFVFGAPDGCTTYISNLLKAELTSASSTESSDLFMKNYPLGNPVERADLYLKRFNYSFASVNKIEELNSWLLSNNPGVSHETARKGLPWLHLDYDHDYEYDQEDYLNEFLNPSKYILNKLDKYTWFVESQLLQPTVSHWLSLVRRPVCIVAYRPSIAAMVEHLLFQQSAELLGADEWVDVLGHRLVTVLHACTARPDAQLVFVRVNAASPFLSSEMATQLVRVARGEEDSRLVLVQANSTEEALSRQDLHSHKLAKLLFPGSFADKGDKQRQAAHRRRIMATSDALFDEVYVLRTVAKYASKDVVKFFHVLMDEDGAYPLAVLAEKKLFYTLVQVIYNDRQYHELLQLRREPRSAYVTLLTSANVNYAYGAVVLGFSIALLDATRDRVVMVTSDVSSEIVQFLRSYGWIVRPVEKIEEFWFGTPKCRYHPINGMDQEVRWGRMTSKLRLWELDEYETVMYLDTDTLLTGLHVREVFDFYYLHTKQHQEGTAQSQSLLSKWVFHHNTPQVLLLGEAGTGHKLINAGVLILQTSRDALQAMLRFARKHDPPRLFPNLVDCTEQALINAFFGRPVSLELDELDRLFATGFQPSREVDQLLGDRLAALHTSSLVLSASKHSRFSIARPDVVRDHVAVPAFAVHFVRQDRCRKPWAKVETAYAKGQVAPFLAANYKEFHKAMGGLRNSCDVVPYVLWNKIAFLVGTPNKT